MCVCAWSAHHPTARTAAPHSQVLSEHPTYIDCYLRLACIARAKGNHKEALEFAQVRVCARRRRSYLDVCCVCVLCVYICFLIPRPTTPALSPPEPPPPDC